jgi:hypothetical protein
MRTSPKSIHGVGSIRRLVANLSELAIERAKDCVKKVGCEGLVFVSNRGFAGSAETTAIESDYAIADS